MIKAQLSDALKISADIKTSQLIGALHVPNIVYPQTYEGELRVTPSNEVQILNTENLYLNSNIIIDPVPDNYGLIEWDGSILTVS